MDRTLGHGSISNRVQNAEEMFGFKPISHKDLLKVHLENLKQELKVKACSRYLNNFKNFPEIDNDKQLFFDFLVIIKFTKSKKEPFSIRPPFLLEYIKCKYLSDKKYPIPILRLYRKYMKANYNKKYYYNTYGMAAVLMDIVLSMEDC